MCVVFATYFQPSCVFNDNFIVIVVSAVVVVIVFVAYVVGDIVFHCDFGSLWESLNPKFCLIKCGCFIGFQNESNN